MITPATFAPMLGKTFTDQLSDPKKAPLVIGEDRYTRLQLAQMGIVHMKAATILSAIAADLGSKSLKDFYQHSSPYLLTGYPAGVTTLYVVFAVFDAHDLSIQKWYLAGKAKAVTTFIHLKRKELKAQTEEKRAAKKRARANGHAPAITLTP